MDKLYIPQKARIAGVKDETADVKTFELRLVDGDRKRPDFLPGQFLEVSFFGIGEAPFCISSSPTQQEGFDITVRSVGSVTGALHALEVDDAVGVRGPLGNHFPVDEVKGQDLLIIGGGIGLPPLRSLIHYVLDNRKDYEEVTILYGARTPGDRVYKQELDDWEARGDIHLLNTVDAADSAWKGRVGVVTTLLKEITVDTNKTTAFTCGPPIMIRFVIQELLSIGFSPQQIVTTLERAMKCGVGKCGHCAVGHQYICVHGPVFNVAQIGRLAERV